MSNFRASIWILLTLILISSCKKQVCFPDDPAATLSKSPSYSYSNSTTVRADGYYFKSDGSTNSAVDTNLSHYNQYIDSELVVNPSILTTINLKVSGVVSMCNGRASQLMGTKSNVVSPICRKCSNKLADGSAPSYCQASSCNNAAGTTCLDYCNSNPGKDCPLGFKYPNVPEQCDLNCKYGSKYFVGATAKDPVHLTYDVYPTDKVTFFVDAPNPCGPFLSRPKSGNFAGDYPDVNRFSFGGNTYPYPKDLVCIQNSSSFNDNQNAADAACTPTQDGTNGVGRHNSRPCWISTGTGLVFTMGTSQTCYTGDQDRKNCLVMSDSKSNGSKDYPQNGLYNDPITNPPPNSSIVTPSLPNFSKLGGSPNCQSSSDKDSCAYSGDGGKKQSNLTCQSVSRSFVNGTGSKIQLIGSMIVDEEGSHHDNHGGYTVYVEHESCRASNGASTLANSNGSGKLEVVMTANCSPNDTANCSKIVPLDLKSYKNNTCKSANSSKCKNDGDDTFCDPCSDGSSKAKFCPSWDQCSKDSNANFYAIKPQDLVANFSKKEIERGVKVWFRVKPEDNATPYYSKGSLNVEYAYGTAPAGLSDTIADVVSYFSTDVMASLKEQFVNITCTGDIGSCSCTSGLDNCAYSYFYYIRILLMFYIVGLGLTFIMGMTKITQYDLITRLFKFGVLLALTRPDSWNFFYDNFFQVFIGGTADLINKSVNQSFLGYFAASCKCIPAGMTQGVTQAATSTGECPAGYVLNPFCFADFGFNMLFTNSTLWYKLAVYYYLSPLTQMLFWIMVYGIWLYIVAIFQAVVTYIMSIISIAILLLLAPIFLPFMLFKLTQSLFENWIKYLIQRTLEPVLLLIGLNILTMLMYMVLHEILDFQVCMGNLITLNVPQSLAAAGGSGTGFFALQFFTPMGYSAGGGGATQYSFTTSFAYFMIFIMLLLLMKNYGSYISNIVNRISSLRLQQFVTTGGGGGGPSVAHIPGKAAAYMLGQDAESKARRSGEISERLNMRKTNAEVTSDRPGGQGDGDQPSGGDSGSGSHSQGSGSQLRGTMGGSGAAGPSPSGSAEGRGGDDGGGAAGPSPSGSAEGRGGDDGSGSDSDSGSGGGDTPSTTSRRGAE
ncbi:MAG: type IV secretion system protein [Rickettsiales bacterium]